MLYYENDQDRNKILLSYTEKYFDYCIQNWTNSKGNFFTVEDKVKYFLDGCANFLMHSNGGGLSEYKQKQIAQSEIPVTSCSEEVKDLVYSIVKDGSGASKKLECLIFIQGKRENSDNKSKQKAKPSIRRDKNIKSAICIVDTDGEFLVGRTKYKINNEIEEYAPQEFKGEECFGQDRIYVIFDSSGKRYFDMNLNEISSEAISIA